MEAILLGTTDRTILVFIPDPASTDGSGKTGLVAANLTVSYTRIETDNDVAITDVTASLNNLAALTSAHTDWGLKEVSSTLAPGLYRLDLGDAVFATGAWYAVVYVMITSGSAVATPKAFHLVAFNALDGTGLGLSRIDVAISTRTSAGVGADTITLHIGVADADVWITSDSAGSNVVAGTKQTNSAGDVTFLLDHGTVYYLWVQKDGYNSIQGEPFTAARD